METAPKWSDGASRSPMLPRPSPWRTKPPGIADFCALAVNGEIREIELSVAGEIDLVQGRAADRIEAAKVELRREQRPLGRRDRHEVAVGVGVGRGLARLADGDRVAAVAAIEHVGCAGGAAMERGADEVIGKAVPVDIARAADRAAGLVSGGFAQNAEAVGSTSS